VSVLNEKTEICDPELDLMLAELDNCTNETGKEAANDPDHGDSGHLTADASNDVKVVGSELKSLQKKSSGKVVQRFCAEEDMSTDSKSFKLYPEGVHELDIEKVESGIKKLRDKISSNELLLRLLKESPERFLPTTSDYDGNESLRQKFLCINLLLNESLLIAPVFRSFEKGERIQAKEGEKAFSRDKQLIDLHWIYCKSKAAGRLRKVEFDELVVWDKDGFYMGQALHVVSAGLSPETKCKRLSISTELQTTLSTLRKNAVSQKWRRIEKDLSDIEQDLTDLSDSPESRFDFNDIEIRLQEWTCLKLAKWSNTKATEYWSLMTGIILDDKNKGSIKKTFERRQKLFKGLNRRVSASGSL